MSTPDDRLMQTADELQKGGWIVAVLGSAGALCRLMLSNERRSAWTWVRRFIGGGIVGVLCYFAIHGLIDPMYEAVVYSASGALAPDLLEPARRKVFAFLKFRRQRRRHGKTKRHR